MPSVLFVCTGNLCRSPLAEYLFRQQLHLQGLVDGWQVGSAGTWTRDGMSIQPFIQELLLPFNAELDEHRTRTVTKELIVGYDVIVVMEKGQKEALVHEFPSSEKRVHMLTALASLFPYDIKDPVMQDAETANEILTDMQECLRLAFETIVRTARENGQNRTTQ